MEIMKTSLGKSGAREQIKRRESSGRIWDAVEDIRGILVGEGP
jgi:hypothetical protein